MKNTLLKLMLCLHPFIWSACEKPYDEDKKIGPPLYSSDQLLTIISGKWQMQTAMQVDEKSLTKETMDITDFFTQEPGSNAPSIVLKTDYTFTADTAGVVVNYFGITSGKWSFDDPAYPTKINLSDANNQAIGSISIGTNLLGANPKLLYTKTSMCGSDKAFTFNIDFLKK